MAIPALYLEEGFYPPVSQHGNIGLDAGGTLELIEFDSIYFLHPVNGRIRLARQFFNLRFPRNARRRI